MISIVAPVYNVEKYLDKFLKSILNQTYTDFELLLITDCPTDKSVQICEEYAKKDQRIKIIKQEKNGGVAKARNKGLSEAHGDYIMLADSDDYLEYNALDILYKNIKKNNSDISMGVFYCDVEGEIKIKKFRFAKKIYTHDEAIKHHLNFRTLYGYPWGKLFKKEILRNVKNPEDMSSGEDGVFSLEALKNSNKLTFVEQPVYYYRIRRDSLSGHGGNFGKRDLDVFKQISYIEEILRNDKQYDKDIKVFKFALLYGAIEKYEASDEDSKIRYIEDYNKMKSICNNICNNVICNSINPRIRFMALKYKINNGK